MRGTDGWYYTNSNKIAECILNTGSPSEGAVEEALRNQIAQEINLCDKDFHRFSMMASDYYSDFLGILSDSGRAGRSPVVDLGHVESRHTVRPQMQRKAQIVELFSVLRVSQVAGEYGFGEGMSYGIRVLDKWGNPYDIRQNKRRRNHSIHSVL